MGAAVFAVGGSKELSTIAGLGAITAAAVAVVVAVIDGILFLTAVIGANTNRCCHQQQ